MRALQLILTAFVLASATACSKSSTAPDPSSLEAAASEQLQHIPSADPEKYRNIRDMKNWRNPYLLVLPEGIGLLDLSNNEQHLLNPDDVLRALADLPASAWPYGRVVVVSQNAVTGSEEQRIAIRRNKGILAGSLENAHVLINWVPSA